MFNISKENRDMIVNYLNQVTVPAKVGADLIQIVSILNGLKSAEKEEAKPEPVAPEPEGK